MELDQYARAHLWAPPGRAEQQQSDVKIKVGLHALVSLFSAAPHLPKLESFCQEESPRTLWTPGAGAKSLTVLTVRASMFRRPCTTKQWRKRDTERGYQERSLPVLILAVPIH
ncbi:Uncharacterized protein DAT39_017157 [Clarias magur]|uniref:Uncharacterized protein n=1 Tax=Clarias magur TaxID=1594786 RepID=A0A8J4WV54_CLAMG|nr:Uncharacterized protein DAT39_017157 [Clarias magur]